MAADDVFSWTNVKGGTYFLHRRVDARGKDRFVFARAIGEGALAEVPEGYEVHETLNGVVSLGKVKPRIIREDEERLVAQAVHGVHRHAVEVKKNVIYVMAGTATSGFNPVLQFTLVDVDERRFQVCRMRYTRKAAGRTRWRSARCETSSGRPSLTSGRTASTHCTDA